MRILHLYKDYYPVLGGIENHIRLLAEVQAALGHDVTVLVTNLGARTAVEQVGGVRVIKAGRLATVARAPISLDFPRLLARQRPDVAHLHFPYPFGEVSHLFLGRARRTVITYHSDVVRQKGWLRLYRPLLWRVLRRADRIVATSPKYVESSPFLRPLADRCTVIPLGIDLARFQADRSAEARDIRARFCTPLPTGDAPDPLILFVGLLRYYKGLSILLQAMTDIHARLLVIGEGPMAGEWKRMANDLGLNGRVFFLGEIANEQLPAFYQAADMFVLPATQRSEAFGLVQVEAMASGLPIISTEVGTGTSWVNQHGETGLVVPPGDVQALALAIRTLLADPARRRQMGQRGRERANRDFSRDVMADRVLALYEELLAGPKVTER